MFPPRADWHAELPPRPPQHETRSSTGKRRSSAVATELKSHGRSILASDSERYSSSKSAAGSHKFLASIMTSGTLSDKVSALTLAIQESPLHNVRAFEALLALASKKNRTQSAGALSALVDLLGPGLLLPADRRLRYFDDQPGLWVGLDRPIMAAWKSGSPLPPAGISEKDLVSWAYEDWLKETYYKVIQLLEQACSDPIEHSRSKGADLVYTLLKEKPEQEANLLRLLVNKLGDKSRRISSRVSYLLLQLQNSHPGMKVVIVTAIQGDILLRPGQSTRTLYNATNTMNQTILSTREPNTAKRLLGVYFDLFVTLLKSSPADASPAHSTDREPRSSDASSHLDPTSDENDKLMSSILTGINRAIPFTALEDSK